MNQLRVIINDILEKYLISNFFNEYNYIIYLKI